MSDNNENMQGGENDSQPTYGQMENNNNSSYEQPYSAPPYGTPKATPSISDVYGQPENKETTLEEPVSVGEWLVSYLLLMIPCAGIVLMFVWAFGGNEKKSKSNFFKAALIMSAIMAVIWFIVAIIIGVGAVAAIGKYSYY